ncbi:hypothetical protein F4X10_17770 [Candidatus Poribacteria bacterium]|nr:hypothetical protein [Candidatus Poribacteria bacterium]
MFTVRNAENAMITFSIIGMALLIGVFLHQFMLRGDGFVNSLYAVAENISKIMSAATMLTILEEGIDIMFQRIRDTLKKEKQLIAEVTAEVTAKAKAEAKAEVYQEIAEWDQRRRQAEARGEPFTEPPPGPPEKRSKQ